MMSYRFSLFVPFSILLSNEVSAADSPMPLRIYAQSPEQSISLENQLRSAFPISNNGVELFASGTIASIWANSVVADLDYYQNHVFAGMNWHVTQNLQAELKFQYTYAADNRLDTLTIDFHDMFSIDQNGRDKVPKHQFNISSIYGNEIHDFKGETLVRALHGYMQYHLFMSGPHALAVGGSLYYKNVDDGPFKDSAFEQGAQINYSYAAGPHSIFTTAGLVHRDDDTILIDAHVKDTTTTLAIGYGFKFGGIHEVHLEYYWYEGFLSDDSAFSKPSTEVVLGYRLNLGNTVLELATVENMGLADNSTDIAFMFGIRSFL